MKPPAGDRLRVLLTCDPSAVEAVASFYCKALGFETEYRQRDGAATLVGLRLDGTRLLLATPGALGVAPDSPTTEATVILMRPDVAAHRRAVSARFEGTLGPIRTLGDGAFYELIDPGGNRVWIMQVP